MGTKPKYKLTLFEDADGTNTENDNIDVLVRLEDGREYIATFFTLANIASLMKRWEETGECANGTYFWCADMVIVRNLERETIVASIDALLASGEFETIFEGPIDSDE